MGNQAAKRSKTNLLSPDEATFVDNSFKSVSGNSDKLSDDILTEAWAGLVDPHLVTHIKDCCFGQETSNEQRAITIKPYAEHYYVTVKGSLYEKSNYINTRILGNPERVEGGISPASLFTFVSSVVRSYFIMLDYNKTDQYQSWLERNVCTNYKDLDNYAHFLLRDLSNIQPISLDDLENWLHLNPLWLEMWKAVVVFLYSHNQRSALIPASNRIRPKTLPFCEVPLSTGEVKSILNVGQIMFIIDQLPMEFRDKWKLLFSSKVHGESFATFLGKLTSKGPTVIVVEDEQNYVFGGFAPESWILSPKFFGNDSAVLFTLQPTMQCFGTSGYNDHYQYLNTNQQTLPNGLGMGGQFDYWGLWLDYDYGSGHCAESCTTFRNYKQMSANKEFRIKNLEVWAVGEEPKEDLDADKNRSILDSNLEEKAVLQLAGKQLHSEGLRDPDMDD